MRRAVLQRAREAWPADVVAGLTGTPRSVPSKYFYDERGSSLFDRICESPEYYPTRVEMGILRAQAPEISRWVGALVRVVEFGSGSGQKTRQLLSCLDRPREYVPVDICSPQLFRSATALRRLFPGLTVSPVLADYAQPLVCQLTRDVTRTVCFFPGSSVGNFEPLEAVAFLIRAARLAGPGGGLLIGVDLKKDAAILHRAYNDAAGVTAAFNRNVLAHVNELCDADFEPLRFGHVAFYNEHRGRVEMHLESAGRQVARLGTTSPRPILIELAQGERIRTEHSYKYDVDEFRGLAAEAGWVWRHIWLDPERWFGLHAFDVLA